MENGAIMKPVVLMPMRQLTEAKCEDDDWTGLKDQAERRKRQTRLSLRAYRKRKAAQRVANPKTGSESTSRLGTESAQPRSSARMHSDVFSAPALFIPSAVTQGGQLIPMRYLYPISRDHLLPLIEYNIWRAITTNILILGHLHFLNSSVCRFTQSDAVFPSTFPSDSLPKSLQPTSLQRSTPHEDWIDLIPSPKMRDNAIRTQHLFSNLEMCSDLLGGLHGRQNDLECGLRVWSDPWNPDAWELTEGFARKYRILVDGCADLFKATNRWRRLRGEKPLVWEVE
ncbi:hypothetical protein H2200_007838 [Cladophialophora chaetospira]|uniref:BZIP domain-containing protein n=1 Tax=Cladophialophora chaetospira TaxID=386627 RepID=A0AA38X6I5_9EURO|nr:hypothetical protein H2200_007838 [Cladophialophora chaetospira]